MEHMYNVHGTMISLISWFQNNETAAMLLYQTNPVGDQLFSYVNTFFCSNNLHGCWKRACMYTLK